MEQKKVRTVIIVLSGLFLIIDQLLKTAALNMWGKDLLPLPFFGWRPFFNRGIAFGLPINNSLTIIVSGLLLCGVAGLAIDAWKKKDEMALLGWTLIWFGAISNFIDRIGRGFVVDYLFLITGYINLGDLMIAAGLVLLLFFVRKNR